MDLVELDTRTLQRHPWENARLAFFRGQLERAGVFAKAAHLLDIGAGDAWLSRQLADDLPRGSSITCWDAFYTPASMARVDTHPGVPTTLTAEQPDTQADVILLLDVLEHVEHDQIFLRSILAKNSHRGTRVLVSVPAWPFLFNAHDRELRHFRRYTPSQGRALLEGAGLTVERAGGLFHSLFVARSLATMARRVLRLDDTAEPHALRWEAGAVVTAAVRSALQADNAAAAMFSSVEAELPGLSWWALCSM